MSSVEPPLPPRFPQLSSRAQRGSKPRCHILTHGSREEVARRLTSLIEPFGSVSSTDKWMPQGFESVEEAQLHLVSELLDAETSNRLGSWWLAVGGKDKTTPNFDIASTCTIGGSRGLLLIEAKAHDYELTKEACGRTMVRKSKGRLPTEREREEQKLNHEQIGVAIQSARAGLSDATALEWKISRDTHYQMSNRFAWTWKLTDLGTPVVLVYLGLLQAEDMRDPQRTPLTDHATWEKLVRDESKEIVPTEAWNKSWTTNGQSFAPLIRSIHVPLELPR